jgi:hypothetical protein
MPKIVAKNILVIIPHASCDRPKEIKKEWLSINQKALLYSEVAETDRCSDKLYDFRQILGNRQAVFPYSQVYLNICRHPKQINSICPIDIRGVKVYGRAPSVEFRKKLVNKYAAKYYKQIASFKKGVIFSGHTTVSGHSSLDVKLKDQIIISSYLLVSKKVVRYAPDELIKLYVSELKRLLPKVKIGINSAYLETYDYLADKFGWKNARVGLPMIHQETDESLYIVNNKLDRKKLNKLREIFANALYLATQKYEENKRKK